MKKTLLGMTLMTAATLGVIAPSQNIVAQEVVSVGKGLSWLGKRIQSLEIGTLAYEMEKDGVKERSFVAVFSASGAIIQNDDLTGDDNRINAGMQLLPYTVSLTDDGRKFISVAGFAMREMNKAYGEVASVDGDMYYDDTWKIINNVDVLVYEYDENFTNSNTITHRLDLVRAEAKLDILGSSKPGHFLAVVGGVNAGFMHAKIKNGDETIALSTDDGKGFLANSFDFDYKIGLEYNLPVSKRSNLNISGMLNGGGHNGLNFNKDEKVRVQTQLQEDLDQFYADKREYELENLEGTEISLSSYEALTGIEKPHYSYDAPKGRRSYLYVTPSIKFDTKLSKEGTTSLEFNVFGNLSVKESYKNDSGVNLNLKGTHSRPLFGAGIKLKF